MESRMNEFREFVKNYEGVREAVKANEYTWQQIYENWVMLGENDPFFAKYKTKGKSNEGKPFLGMFENEKIKNIITQVKKINPDNVTKTLNTVQKVLQITQNFGAKPPQMFNANYNSWWD